VSWRLSIPYQHRDERLVDTASHCRTLEDDDRTVTRSIVLDAAMNGMRTAGDLLDHLDSLEPAERRQLLDQARAEAGLPGTAEVDARERLHASGYSTTSGIASCAIGDCDNVPVRPEGIFYDPECAAGTAPRTRTSPSAVTFEPRASVLTLSPSGVPIDADPAEEARDRAREASRRAQREAEAADRAVEAAERRASNEARDAAHRSELPEHLDPGQPHAKREDRRA
jgi:hypothetical protein